ncbi:carboxylesterase family protein [Pseudonocardia kujensis]|nr:carboxylesterase family protein [Pseudonocardia kujensis]
MHPPFCVTDEPDSPHLSVGSPDTELFVAFGAAHAHQRQIRVREYGQVPFDRPGGHPKRSRASGWTVGRAQLLDERVQAAGPRHGGVAVGGAYLVQGGRPLRSSVQKSRRPDGGRCEHRSVNEGVRVEGGIVKGTCLPDLGVRRFLGIPYASPPTGANRWRPPQPVVPWEGVRAASEFGPASWQLAPPAGSLFSGRESRFSEDCLTLNVWTGPAADTDRPVLVWLHFGAFHFGSASNPLYDGARLASRGITVVGVNYRLGRLGFLAHPDLSAETTYGGSGNYGLMDQIAALEWVRRNIGAFGGDPGNVTLAGVSAGGDSAQKLRCSPRAQGLFHRVIAHSGPGVTPAIDGPGNPAYASTLAAAEQAGVELFAALGVGSVAEARALDPEVILRADLPRTHGAWVSDSAPGGLSVHRYDSGYPVVDGYVLTEPVQRSFAQGRAADLPALVGNVTDEQAGARYLPTVTAYRAYLEVKFGDRADEVFELYPAPDDAATRKASWSLAGDEVFIMPSWNAALLHSENLRAPVWHFRFTRRPPVPARSEVLEGAEAGAFHTADVLYLFGTYEDRDWDWTEADHVLAARMQDAWISFVRSGDPTDGGRIEWPALDARSPRTKVWDLEDSVADILDTRRLTFWRSYWSGPGFVG